MRILSGIRPTGVLHLGNYFGAIKQFIQMQNEPGNECFYFVADLHALTTHLESAINIREQSIDTVRMYLACGVDPSRAVIYLQSDIPQIPYLSQLLAMIAPEGELRRCTTYKDKVTSLQDTRQTINVGLLTYPVLMAADILFCNADRVPVGEDQLQHLEITREIARRYNSHIGKELQFVEPQPQEVEAIRVPGLTGQGKMSKSSNSEADYISLLDSASVVKKKIMAAVTDTGPVVGEPMTETMKDLYQLVRLCCSDETYAEYKEKYETGQQKFYGSMKKQLAADVVALLEPIQDRYNSAECSAEYVNLLLIENAEKVRLVASHTLNSVLADFGIREINPSFM